MVQGTASEHKAAMVYRDPELGQLEFWMSCDSDVSGLDRAAGESKRVKERGGDKEEPSSLVFSRAAVGD